MARIPCQQVMTLEFLSITLKNFLGGLYVSQRDTRLLEIVIQLPVELNSLQAGSIASCILLTQTAMTSGVLRS